MLVLQMLRQPPRRNPAPVEVLVMTRYSLRHVNDEVLLRDLASAVARERTATADVLAHIAEVDERRLFVPAGYPSMYLYCVQELRLSEDAAAKRIQAARIARRFPIIFEAMAQGRLHLSGVVLLAPYLIEETAGGLLATAAGRTKAEIERLLAERFPKSDLLAWVAPMPGATPSEPIAEHAPGHVDDPQVVANSASVLGPLTPERVVERPRVTPLSSESFGLQVTLDRSTHEKLRHAQDLLGHQIPGGDIAAVLDRVLDLAIAQLERQKFAATDRPRQNAARPSANPRHIPARVRRAVWKRDGGQCTFVSETGHRCEARKPLEFDHTQEVARGGEATVAGIRLRCRAHNQYAAECTFGREFMRHQRLAAAEGRAAKRARALAAGHPPRVRAPRPRPGPAGYNARS